MHFFQNLFGSGGFQPHGFCYNWNTGLVWLHVLSDALIAISYFAIPVVLLAFVRKRRDIPFSWLFLLFGAFIVACGVTHLMEIWNLWHAQYWLAGAIKAFTAVASVGTAVVLARAIPAVLRVPNLSDWAKANANLETLVAQRTRELSLANDELRESRDSLRLAQRAGKIGTWERNLLTGRSTFSPELEELLGLPAGAAAGDPEILRSLLHDEDRAKLENDRAEAIREGHEVATDVRALRADGKPLWLLSRSNIIRDSTGRAVRLAGVTVDITDRRKAEEQVRILNASLEARVSERTRDLRNANKELESFSYSVSHDLRSPLRTIDGFSLALLEDCGDKLDEVGKGHLQRIRAATQRMGQLIDDLLNLSRVTRAQLKSEICNLSDIVTSVAHDLQAAHPERHVSWDIQPGLSVTGDPQLLRVVVENLLGNAWKYTSRRPSASIGFGKTDNNGSSAFFVKDDGAGFDPAYADRLFGAFQRLHSPAEFPGTGVGLATVQRVIHRQGGEIWAESAVDKGATFFFTVPLSDPAGAKE